MVKIVVRGKSMKSILFLCVANSARSQMAEGLARKILGSDYQIQSAGSNPSFVHPLSIETLSELGIKTSVHKSKSVNEIDLSKVDLIITLCSEEVCPIVPGNVERLHWPLNDPAKHKDGIEQIEFFREIRDEIKERIEILKKEMESK